MKDLIMALLPLTFLKRLPHKSADDLQCFSRFMVFFGGESSQINGIHPWLIFYKRLKVYTFCWGDWDIIAIYLGCSWGLTIYLRNVKTSSSLGCKILFYHPKWGIFERKKEHILEGDFVQMPSGFHIYCFSIVSNPVLLSWEIK